MGRRDYDCHRIRKLFDELAAVSVGKEFGDDILAASLFNQVMVYLCRAGSAAHSESDPLIDSVIKYINANLSEDLSIERLCERFFISKTRLIARFREITGTTPHQYIKQKRIILAARYMEEKNNAAQAGSKAGFSDYSAFYRAFVKEYGISPRDY